MAKKEATALSVMAGNAHAITIGDKEYKVKPLKIKDNEEFNNLNYGSQFFTLNDQGLLDKLNNFMSRYLLDSHGEPMTVEKCGEDDWDIADLKSFLKKVIEISG